MVIGIYESPSVGHVSILSSTLRALHSLQEGSIRAQVLAGSLRLQSCSIARRQVSDLLSVHGRSLHLSCTIWAQTTFSADKIEPGGSSIM